MSDLVLPGHIAKELRDGGPPDAETLRFTLTEMAEEFVFFNHGALFAFAEFRDPDEDPINDWYASMPKGMLLIKHPFDRAIFEGIDAPAFGGRLTWNHVLCAVLKDDWLSLFPFLNGVASVSQKTKSFYQVFSGDVKILDPVLVERHGLMHPQIPHVQVTVFCVDGNRARWEIRHAASALGCPRLVKIRPRQEVVDVGADVLSGDPAKLSTIENPAFAPFLERYKRVLQEGPQIVD